METKRFDEWNEIKKKLQKDANKPPFKCREVWWYAAGENLGTEIYGKDAYFSRPILIIRKYGAESFFGIPLSSQSHQGRWYATLKVLGIDRCALLSQAGSFSVYRLLKRMDRVSMVDYLGVINRLERLLFPKNSPS